MRVLRCPSTARRCSAGSSPSVRTASRTRPTRPSPPSPSATLRQTLRLRRPPLPRQQRLKRLRQPSRLPSDEATTEDASTEATDPSEAGTEATDAPTDSPTPGTDDDALLSPGLRLALSIAGGVAALTVLVVLGIRKIRAREAQGSTTGAPAAPQTGEVPDDDTSSDEGPGTGR